MLIQNSLLKHKSERPWKKVEMRKHQPPKEDHQEPGEKMQVFTILIRKMKKPTENWTINTWTSQETGSERGFETSEQECRQRKRSAG
jgi:hypothetical protein